MTQLDSSGPLKPVTKRPWSGCGIARVGTHHQTIVAYLAMSGSYIDRMYVDPTDGGRDGDSLGRFRHETAFGRG